MRLHFQPYKEMIATPSCSFKVVFAIIPLSTRGISKQPASFHKFAALKLTNHQRKIEGFDLGLVMPNSSTASPGHSVHTLEVKRARKDP